MTSPEPREPKHREPEEREVVAKRDRPRRRARMWPVWTILLLLALAGGSAALWLVMIPRFTPPRAEVNVTRARTIRSAVVLWIPDHPEGGCPTVADLIASKNLDSTRDGKDGWGRAFRVSCDGGDVLVSSAGKDGIFGTDDDISS